MRYARDRAVVRDWALKGRELNHGLPFTFIAYVMAALLIAFGLSVPNAVAQTATVSSTLLKTQGRAHLGLEDSEGKRANLEQLSGKVVCSTSGPPGATAAKRNSLVRRISTEIPATMV
jgi:hypothetical protein